MTGSRHRQRLTVVLQPHELVHHHALATELLARARRAGLAGATVLEAAASPEGAGDAGQAGQGAVWFVAVDEAAVLARFVASAGDLLDGHPYRLDDVAAFRA
ncbi:MAG: hypothetical protein M0T71_07640 [Actinomycetota bacterium]|nr:hypothetical protein [Actinomycetota bacterium]